MISLTNIVEFCDNRVNRKHIQDYPGAHNGLQLENNGYVKKIGAAVDAGQLPFEQAIQKGMGKRRTRRTTVVAHLSTEQAFADGDPNGRFGPIRQCVSHGWR